MKIGIRTLQLIPILSATIAVPQIHAGLLSYDGFDGGTSAGQALSAIGVGTSLGFATGWSTTAIATNNAGYTTGAGTGTAWSDVDLVTNSNLLLSATAGSSLGTATAHSRFIRTLDAAALAGVSNASSSNGEIWISFMGQRNGTTLGGVELLNTTAGRFTEGFGGFNTNNWNWSDRQTAGTGEVFPVASTTQSFISVQLVFGATSTTIRMFVNQSGNLSSLTNVPSVENVIANTSNNRPNFDAISVYGGFRIDELRIGTTYADTAPVNTLLASNAGAGTWVGSSLTTAGGTLNVNGTRDVAFDGTAASVVVDAAGVNSGNGRLEFRTGGHALSGGSITTANIYNAAGANSIANSVTARFAEVASGSSLSLGGGTLTNGLYGSGGLIKTGSGTLVLSRASVINGDNNTGAQPILTVGRNNYTGTLTVSQGTVRLTGANAMGTGAIVVGDASTGAAAATFDVAFPTTIANPITVSANGTGTATIGNGTAITGITNFTGAVTLNRPTTIVSSASDRIGWTGKISGNVGTLTVTGGFRTVFDNAAGVNDFVGDVVVNGTGTVLQTGVVSGTGEVIPNASSVTLNAGTFFKLANNAGATETINALNGTGTMRRHEGVGGLTTLVLGSAGGSGTFGGTLENGGGTLAIRKEGSGTQTITSFAGNTASGGITVNGGVLKFTGTASAGFDAGTFNTAQTYTVNNGGTLEIAGDWLTKTTSTYNINAGGTLTFSSPGVVVAGDRTINYVNNLNLTDATVNGPSTYRIGNNTTATHNFSGNLGNTIATGFGMVKNGAAQTVNLNVNDGTADADLTVSGPIIDVNNFAGATLNKAGAGKLVLTAANTFVGPLTISAGILQIGDGGATGNLGSGAVTNNSTLVVNRSGILAIPSAISGSGVLNHVGSGTTTLTGANTYTGATNVTAGTLVTTPAQTGATSVTVADGATFGVALASAGTTFAVGTLSSGVSTGASLRFDTGALGNSTAPVVGATTFTPAGPTTLRVLGSNLSAGTFTLIDYSGAIGGSGYAGLSLALPFRVGGALVDNSLNSSVDVTITGAETAKWQGGVAGGDWDIDPDGGNTAGTFNWKTSIFNTPTRYAQGSVNTDNVTFDDTATGTTTVNLTTTLAPLSTTVNNTASNYIFTGPGKISGVTGLTKQGNGTLTLANTGPSDFTGPVSIQSGTVSTALVANAFGAGIGAVTLGGSASTGTFEYTGATATTNRTLALAAGGSGKISVATAGNALTLSGVVGGGGALVKSGPGQVVLTGANTYTGGTTISAGRLDGSTNAAFGTGPIVIGDTAENAAIYLAQRADVSNPVTVSALGTGTVIIGADNSGSGANASTFAGLMTLNRPTTFSGEVTGDRLAIDGQITGNVGTLTVTGGARTTFFSTANDFVGDILITGAGTILQASVATAAETIPNTSSVTVDTGAVLQLASTGGPETINALNGAGTVRTFSGGVYGAGLVVGSANGSGSFSGVIQNGTIGNPLSLTKSGSGTQTLSGTNTYTGPTVVAAGTLAITGSVSGTTSIDVQSGATLDVSGASGGFVVGASQTLNGSGTVLGATTIAGTLAPGASPGTLTFNDALTIGSTAAVTLEIGGTNPGEFDKIAGVTNLMLDGTFTVSLFGGFVPVPGNTFDVLDWSGTLDATGFNVASDLVLPGLSLDYTWDTSSFTTDGTLTVIPEPGSTALLLGGMAMFASRRRSRRSE